MIRSQTASSLASSNGKPFRIVYVNLSINEISKISGVEGTAHVDMILRCAWQEDRSWNKHDWVPEVFILNSRLGSFKEKEWSKVYHEDGFCKYEKRIEAEVTLHFDLRSFPFDFSLFEMRLELRGETSKRAQLCWGCWKDGMKMVQQLRKSDKWEHTSHSDRVQQIGEKLRTEKWEEAVYFTRPGMTRQLINTSGWQLRGLMVWSEHAKAHDEGKDYDALYVYGDLQRSSYFYVMKVFLLSVVIAMVSLFSFQMGLDEFSKRIMLVLSSLIASVALLWIIQSAVPKVNYLTVADKFIYATFGFLVSVGVALVAIDHRYHDHDQADSAAELAKSLCWMLPSCYFLVIIMLVGRPFAIHMHIKYKSKEQLPLVPINRQKKDFWTTKMELESQPQPGAATAISMPQTSTSLAMPLTAGNQDGE